MNPQRRMRQTMTQNPRKPQRYPRYSEHPWYRRPYHCWDDYDWYNYDWNDYDWNDYDWYDHDYDYYSGQSRQRNDVKGNINSKYSKNSRYLRVAPLLVYNLFEHVKEVQPPKEHLESMITKMISLDNETLNYLDMSNYDDIIKMDNWKSTQTQSVPVQPTPTTNPTKSEG